MPMLVINGRRLAGDLRPREDYLPLTRRDGSLRWYPVIACDPAGAEVRVMLQGRLARFTVDLPASIAVSVAQEVMD